MYKKIVLIFLTQTVHLYASEPEVSFTHEQLQKNISTVHNQEIKDIKQHVDEEVRDKLLEDLKKRHADEIKRISQTTLTTAERRAIKRQNIIKRDTTGSKSPITLDPLKLSKDELAGIDKDLDDKQQKLEKAMLDVKVQAQIHKNNQIKMKELSETIENAQASLEENEKFLQEHGMQAPQKIQKMKEAINNADIEYKNALASKSSDNLVNEFNNSINNESISSNDESSLGNSISSQDSTSSKSNRPTRQQIVHFTEHELDKRLRYSHQLEGDLTSHLGGNFERMRSNHINDNLSLNHEDALQEAEARNNSQSKNLSRSPKSQDLINRMPHSAQDLAQANQSLLDAQNNLEESMNDLHTQIIAHKDSAEKLTELSQYIKKAKQTVEEQKTALAKQGMQAPEAIKQMLETINKAELELARTSYEQKESITNQQTNDSTIQSSQKTNYKQKESITNQQTNDSTMQSSQKAKAKGMVRRIKEWFAENTGLFKESLIKDDLQEAPQEAQLIYTTLIQESRIKFNEQIRDLRIIPGQKPTIAQEQKVVNALKDLKENIDSYNKIFSKHPAAEKYLKHKNDALEYTQSIASDYKISFH